MKHFKLLFVLVVSVALFYAFSIVTFAAESDTDKHYFYVYYGTNTRIECFVEGSRVVAYTDTANSCADYSKHYYETKSFYSSSISFYRLNSSRTGVEQVSPRKSKVEEYQNGVWVVTTDYADSNYPFLYAYSSTIDYKNSYVDFSNSDFDFLEVNLVDRRATISKATGGIVYDEVSHSVTTNLYSYLLNGTFTDFGLNYVFTLHENVNYIVPELYRSSSLSNSDITLSLEYDEENGVVSWNDFVVDESSTIFKGVIATLYDTDKYTSTYRSVLTGLSYELSFGGCDFKTGGRYQSITFIPYYISTDGYLYFGRGSSVSIDEGSVAATRSADKMLNPIIRSNSKPSAIYPSKGDTIINPDIINEKAVFSSDLGYIDGLSFTIDDGHSGGFPYVISYKLTWNTSKAIDAYIQVCVDGYLTYIDESNTKRQRSDSFDIVHYNDRIAYKNGVLMIPIDDVDKYAELCFSDYSEFSEQYLFVRLIRFNDNTKQYECGGWTRISLDSGQRYNISTGTIDETGSFTQDTVSEGSYNKDMNFDGTYSDSKADSDGSINLPDLDSMGWFTSTLSSLITSLGVVPQFFATIFGFLPSAIIALIGALVALCVILRILGR